MSRGPNSEAFDRLLDMQAMLEEHVAPDAAQALRVTPEATEGECALHVVRGTRELWVHPEDWRALMTAESPRGGHAVKVGGGGPMDRLNGLPVVFGESPAVIEGDA